ncbi:hypothetical protein N0V90_007539 [Kalmusia sp. IMI 367209]|nr:hypothetical protein N0V90_007539 [Kalmusia sp. IMI 367209]
MITNQRKRFPAPMTSSPSSLSLITHKEKVDPDEFDVPDTSSIPFMNLNAASILALHYFHPNGTLKEWGSAAWKFLGTAALRTPAAIKKEVQEGDLLRRSRELIAPLHANAFAYRPLPNPSCIRLLEVKPGGNSSTIECDLFVVDLKDDPKYTALSYSWRSESLITSMLIPSTTDFKTVAKATIKNGLGKNYDTIRNFKKRYFGDEKQDIAANKDSTDEDAHTRAEEPERIREILCNGQKMRVWPNLFDALAHLRQSHPGRYWIDQLCINQKDEVEKGQQIQMMDSIFGSAQVVQVWLGSCSPYLTNDVKNLLESPLRPDVEIKRENPELVMASLHLLSSLCSDNLIKTIEWVGHSTDVNSEYEGARSFTFLILKMINTFFPIIYENIILVPALLRKRNDFQNGKRWSIFEWLEMSKVRKATNVQDYIYAGLGLVHKATLKIDPDLVDGEHSPPLSSRPGTNSTQMDSTANALDRPKWELWPELRADIQGDIHVLFTNLAACVLSQPHGIDMLSFSQHNSKSEAEDSDLSNLPSWVPTPRSRETPKSLTLLDSMEFQASTHFPNTAKISYDGTELHLDAAKLDTVKRVSGSIMGFFGIAFRILTEDEEFVGPFDPTVLEIIAHVLIAGMRDEVGLSSDEVLRAFLLGSNIERKPLTEQIMHIERKENEELVKAKEKLAKELKSSAAQKSEEKRRKITEKYEKEVKLWEHDVGISEHTIDMIEKTFRTFRAKFPDAPWPDQDHELNEEDKNLLKKYARKFMAIAAPRSIFITDRNMIGLGPSWVKKGDVVMLVKGGKVPYLFVPFDEHLKRDIERLGKKRDKLKEQGEKEDDKKINEKALEKFESDIKSKEEKIGQKDAWWLVGEAYVDGVMNGEAAYSNEFRRMIVV